MKLTWIVVADSCRARFFSMQSRSQPWTELEDLLHMDSKLREAELVSDRQGGLAGSHGGTGHPFEAPTDLKHRELASFAKQIAEKLEQGRVAHRYDNLLLAAPPVVLGALRQALNPQVLELAVETLDKHLVDEAAADIRESMLFSPDQ
jgi:protein required for attachment to host cells